MIAVETRIVIKKGSYVLAIHAGKGAGNGVPDIAEGPAFQVAVIGGYSDIGEDTEDTYVFPEELFGRHGVQDERRAVVSFGAAEAAHAPFDEEERQAHQEKTDEVRDDKRTTAILDGLNGEAKKITQAYGITGHSQYEANAATP